MNSYQLYAAASAAWFTTQSLPAILYTKSFLSTLLADNRELSTADINLTRVLAFFTAGVGVFSLLASGLIPNPLAASGAAGEVEHDKSDATASSSTTHVQYAEYSLLLFATAPLHVITCALYYLHYELPGTSTFFLWVGMAVSGFMATMGGGLYMFGAGAGSDKKMRSHLMFDTPAHRQDVKERHAAKKGL